MRSKLCPSLHYPVPPMKVHLWGIFFALPAMNGPLPPELKCRENTDIVACRQVLHLGIVLCGRSQMSIFGNSLACSLWILHLPLSSLSIIEGCQWILKEFFWKFRPDLFNVLRERYRREKKLFTLLLFMKLTSSTAEHRASWLFSQVKQVIWDHNLLWPNCFSV